MFELARMGRILVATWILVTELDADLIKMIATKRKVVRPSILLAGAAASSLLLAAVLYFQPAGAKPPQPEPIDAVKAYLKASYARDYKNAYRYISSQDQIVWNEKSYASQSESFTGFALSLARNLADSMEVWVIENDKAPSALTTRLVTESRPPMSCLLSCSIGIRISSMRFHRRGKNNCSKLWKK